MVDLQPQTNGLNQSNQLEHLDRLISSADTRLDDYQIHFPDTGQCSDKLRLHAHNEVETDIPLGACLALEDHATIGTNFCEHQHFTAHTETIFTKTLKTTG